MRSVRRPVLAAIVAVLAATTLLQAQSLRHTSPEDVGMSSERLERLTQALQDYVNADRLSGVVAMVLRDGKVAYLEALGARDVEAGAPMEPDAIFRIASQTKALVSVGILALQEDGALLISDRVEKYLPAFANHKVAVRSEGGGREIVDGNRPITVRDLLTHTAGIGYGYGPAASAWGAEGIQGWYFGHRDEPVRATVDRLAKLPFDAQPGERFVYGYNTDILGAVIEQVSGLTLEDFLQTRILDPLGMKDTHFYLPDDKRDRLAAVYNQDADGAIVRAPDGPGMQTQGQYVDGPRKSFSGGAGLLSTAADYGRFLQMMLNGGELDGTRVLSPSTVALMTVDHIGHLGIRTGAGVGFGLGFRVRTDVGAGGEAGSVGDYGWGGAYHSTYWVDPVEDLVVVYFTQIIPATGLDDHAKLRALVYSAIVERRAGM
ncbi:MAG: beta-lactamase family protein [Gemmatimonadetes bacterium]|nr:beta-lactamase family protein [Gemmatimonadota bacterium]